MSELFGFKLPPKAAQDDKGVWRNHHDKPFILRPDGSGLDTYKRASSFAAPLEDLNAIMLWKQRLTALGVAQNPHLLMRLAAVGVPDSYEGKQKLNEIATEAFLSVGGDKKANIGDYLHGLTEQLDLGDDVEIPAQYSADIAAYAAATGHMRHSWIEQFVVCDELKAAGTPDRVSTLVKPMTFKNDVTLPAGWHGIVDLKTGSVSYPHSFSVQLAIYAHAREYELATGKRRLLGNIDQQWALLIHLPAGKGECSIHLLDIAAGWKAASLAQDVSAWRSNKSLTSDHVPNVTVSQGAEL